MGIFSNIAMAFDAVKANKLRSSLTLLSIAIGVFAIVGVGSIAELLNSSVSAQLASLGQNTFTIDRMPHMITSEEEWLRVSKRKPLTYRQAMEFKEEMEEYTDGISITSALRGQIIKAGNAETDPRITIMGGDYDYFELNTRDIEQGRPLSDEDVVLGRKIVVLGKDVATKLFGDGNPIGQEVVIRTQHFQVVGVMAPKGSTFGESMDNIVIIPISYHMHTFADEDDRSVALDVKALTHDAYTGTLDQSIGLMRVMRNILPGVENDFDIITNESLSEQFSSFTNALNGFGIGIAGVALLAAGIGIMNMMLVSVRERTREIGVRKAIGARRSNILVQFIMEAITLCLLGCGIGIALGLLGGFGVSLLMKTTMVLPQGNIILSVSICLALGLIFGTYPAWRASRLDPIETLRYE